MAENTKISLLERAARALCEARGQSVDAVTMSFPDGTTEVSLDAAMRDARAVLQAIREPSGEMLGNVHDTLLYAVKGEELDTARAVWGRMIDAALEEG